MKNGNKKIKDRKKGLMFLNRQNKGKKTDAVKREIKMTKKKWLENHNFNCDKHCNFVYYSILKL